MNLNDLLAAAGVNLNEIIYLRHSMSDDAAINRKRDKESIAMGLKPECVEFYQRIQFKDLFGDYKYAITFLSTESSHAVLFGFFKIHGYTEPIPRDSAPDGFFFGGTDFNKHVLWDLERVSNIGSSDLLLNLENRLIIDWGKDSVNWFKPATRKNAVNIDVLRIDPAISEYEYHGFDNVILSFTQLCEIIKNKKAHRIWEERLSSHAGVYLITDIKTGKLYVGSASSENGGLWGRWSNYINSKHGGNKLLKKLIDKDENYFFNFQFSILEVFPIKRDKYEILQYEQLYKRKLYSIEHGLNDN